MSDKHRSAAAIVLPHGARDPFFAVIKRIALALVLITMVAGLVRLDHDGYNDSHDGEISTLDAFYYATVSVTTTGYGDIVPTSNGARLLSTSFVTIARILFLILLVGTTFEVATQTGRDALAQRRWRKRLRDHTIICGFGTTGQSAARTLLAEGHDPKSIVIIDSSRSRVDEATSLGLAGVVGDASRLSVLTLADATEAEAFIISPNNDAAAVLITLTARELNKNARIEVAVRESQNAHLVRQGGASSVIVSAEAAGRLLGLSTTAPEVVDVLEELLIPGHGLDVVAHRATAEEIGKAPVAPSGQLVLALHRQGNVVIASDPAAATVQPGDLILVLHCATPVKP